MILKLLLFASAAWRASGCTSIVAAKGAGEEGPMVTHTADCVDCDFRINKVPSMDWPEGAERALYQYKGSYPALVTKDRGKTWHPDNLEGTPEQIAEWTEYETTLQTGTIPQVSHTYALYEAGYGIMNEHQLAIGESTCASFLTATPSSAGGKAEIEVRQLSQIALERTKTARDAIQLMGDLATSLGYYSADWSGGDISMGEGGESLQVIDTKEAWVFHVTSDDTGTSAVWAAQRVPDGEVSVVANQFIIREIDTKSDDFMYSKNIFEVAERAKLWSRKVDGDALDFTKTFSPPRMHSPYATRRVWRVFTLLDPDLDIDPETDNYASDYPFSVKPKKPLSARDMMELQRDHYEGTKYDLTQGIASGPYGDPERWDPAPVEGLPTLMDVLQGSYERAVSMFRTSYSIVAVSRGHMPDSIGAIVWFAQYAPHTSTYSPFYVASSDPPEAYTIGSLFKYSSDVSFWNFLACGNWANRFYRYAQPVVKDLHDSLEEEYVSEAKILEQTALDLLKICKKENNCEKNKVDVKITEMLTEFTKARGQQTSDAYRDLFPVLITKFHDGIEATNLDTPAFTFSKLFYPKWWLKSSGYFKNKPNQIPGEIEFSVDPAIPSGYASSSEYYAGVLSSGLFVGLIALVVGFVAGKRDYAANNRHSYTPIDSHL